MLTITDIKNINFRKANLGGYRPEDVDEFIDEVTVSYDQLLKDNAELQKQVEQLGQKLETYRADEDNIRAALMNAQKLGEASIRESKHKSDIILKDAAVKSERIVTNAQNEVAREEEKVDSLRRQIAAFKTRLTVIYKEHMSLIEALPDDDPEPARGERSVERVTRITDVMEDEPKPVTSVYPDDDEDDDDFDADVLRSFSTPPAKAAEKEDDEDDNDVPIPPMGKASSMEEVINPFNSFLSGQKFPVSPVSFGDAGEAEKPADRQPDRKEREEPSEVRADKKRRKEPEEPAPENVRRRDRGGRRGMAMDIADREDGLNNDGRKIGAPPSDKAQNDGESRFGTLKFGPEYEEEEDKDDMPMGMFRRRR